MPDILPTRVFDARRTSSGPSISGVLGAASAIPGPQQLPLLGLSLAGKLIGGLLGRSAEKRKAKDEYKRDVYRQGQARKNRDVGQGFLAMLQRALRQNRAATGRPERPGFLGQEFEDRFLPGGRIDWSAWEPEPIPQRSTPGLFGTVVGSLASGAGDYFGDQGAAGAEARRRMYGG